jgi:hypothetical protein
MISKSTPSEENCKNGSGQKRRKWRTKAMNGRYILYYKGVTRHPSPSYQWSGVTEKYPEERHAPNMGLFFYKVLGFHRPQARSSLVK